MKKFLIAAIFIFAILINRAEALEVSYIDANGNEAFTEDSKTLSVTNNFPGNSDWLAVTSDKVLDFSPSINKSLNIILCDGKTLTINGTLRIKEDNAITIYAQKEGTGKLIISPASSGNDSIYTGVNKNKGKYIQYGGNVQINTKGGAGMYNLDVSLNGGKLEINGKNTNAMNNVNLTLGKATPLEGSICLSYTNLNPQNSKIILPDSKNLFFDENGKTFSLSESLTVDFQTLNEKILVTALKTSFDANNGTDSVDVQYFTSPDQTTLKANSFTLSGYEFDSWNTQSDGSGSSYDDGALITPSELHKKILYAQWKIKNYAINYELDGGTNAQDNTSSYTIKDSITLKDPVKSGYSFAGWTLGGQGSNNIQEGSTGDKTFKANWTANKYNINFNANGGSGSMQSQEFTYDTSQALTSNAFTRNGYTFKNWNTLSDGTGTAYTNAQNITNLSDQNNAIINLYAQWEIINYTINYNLYGGTANNPESYNIETESFTLNNPVKANYIFTGWTGTGLSELTQSVTVNKGSTGERTYTANYKTITTLDVTISGSESITLEKGASKSENYFVSVNATYSDNTSSTLSEGEYSLTWSLSENIAGIAINNNGILTIADTLEAGNYAVTINAQAVSNNINGNASKQVNILVKAAVLESLDVTISGREIISLDEGILSSEDYYVTVNAKYSDGVNKILSEDEYFIIWTLSEDISGISINDNGKLIISNELSPDSYDITIITHVSSRDIQETASKRVNISVKAATLESLDVVISGEASITLNAGDSTSANYSVLVKANYSNGTSKTLSEDKYSIIWTLSEDISGIAINNNGELTLSSNLEHGSHDIEIIAQVSSNDIEGSASKLVNISVKAPELETLNVIINGSENLALNAGNSTASKYSALIKASYSDGTNKTLSESNCALKWTLNENISGIAINDDGKLIIYDSLKAGIYNITINLQVSSQDVKGTSSKRVNIYVRPQESGSESKLKALNITISGAETLTLNAGDSKSAKYYALIKASYSDGTNKTLSENDCALKWTLNENISGIAINDDGELTIYDPLKADNYNITIKAQAEYRGITGGDSINVNISVKTVEAPASEEEVAKYDTYIIINHRDILNLTPEAKRAVTHLELHGSINNLSDIEFKDFTSLITLDLSHSENLETADLSIIPDTVREVNLSGTSINSLTLTGSNVQVINAQDCENLEGLDAQGLTSLHELNVSNTAITSLNLTGCVNLVKLNCSSCELDSEGLILDGCDSLEDLNISANHFTYFDAQDSLNEFECSGQKIFMYESSKYFDLNRGGGTENIINILAYDKDNNELAVFYDKISGLATFETAPALIEYEYITGFESVNMDVKIYFSASDLDSDSESELESENNYHDDRRGGCELGFNIFALSLLAAIMLRKKEA